MPSFYSVFSSPVGELLLTFEGDALTGLLLPRPDGSAAAFPERLGAPDGRWCRDDRAARHVVPQLKEYFEGRRSSFDVPLKMKGTEFQRAVWNALLTVPYGTTVSYAEQARRIGRPLAARAVGAANGKNPIAIIVPCHRVIGASGALVGYGGGLDLKRWLLEHERENPAAGRKPNAVAQ